VRSKKRFAPFASARALVDVVAIAATASTRAAARTERFIVFS
jgi:hypothetical protein